MEGKIRRPMRTTSSCLPLPSDPPSLLPETDSFIPSLQPLHFLLSSRRSVLQAWNEAEAEEEDEVRYSGGGGEEEEGCVVKEEGWEGEEAKEGGGRRG